MITIKHDGKEYKFGINIKENKGINIQSNIPRFGNELDDIMTSLAEFGIGYITLGRLGVPKSESVLIELDGPLPESTIKPLEYLFENVMNTRSLVAGFKRNSKVNLKFKEYLNNKISCDFDSNKVIVPSSGGMDSTAILKFLVENKQVSLPFFVEYDKGETSFIKHEWTVNEKVLSYLGLKSTGNLEHILTPLKYPEIIPWNTDQYKKPYSPDDPVQDTDRWEIWGRNLAFATAMLAYTIKNEAKYINVGHTKEGMFSKFETSDGKIFYDRCCVSLHTINTLNQVLSQIFEEPPAIVSSLRDMNKGDIGRYLLKDPKLFALTRSCIDITDTECGVCFSCLDKYTSIVANSDYSQLEINKIQEGRYNVIFNNKPLASFEWLPTKEDGKFWSKQLDRFLKVKGNMPTSLQNSIYCPDRMIAALYVLDKKGLKEFIPNEFYQIKRKLDEKQIKILHEQYIRGDKLLLPAEFVETSEGLLHKEYTLL